MKFAIDFDGTLAGEATFPDVGEISPLAVQAVLKLQEKGHIVILWTCRGAQALDDAVRALNNRGIFPDLVNANDEETIVKMKADSRKVQADFFLDNKSWPPFPGWGPFLAMAKLEGFID